MIYSLPAVTVGFTSAVGWIGDANLARECRRPTVFLLFRYFLSGTWASTDFHIHFDIHGGSCNQYPADTKGRLYDSTQSLNCGGQNLEGIFSPHFSTIWDISLHAVTMSSAKIENNTKALERTKGNRFQQFSRQKQVLISHVYFHTTRSF